MAALCATRWNQEMEAGRLASFHFLTPEYLKCGKLAFQRERRVYAEKNATTDFYILADDDCLILQPMPKSLTIDVRVGVQSMMPSNANINEWSEAVHGIPNFMDHESCGGVRIIRKGAISEGAPEEADNSFPPPIPGYAGYDLVHSNVMRAAGYRVGYFKNLKMNHLGEGFSTVWRKN